MKWLAAILFLLAGCSTAPVATPSIVRMSSPPMPPTPAAQAQPESISTIPIWTPPVMTLAWDGSCMTNSFDTVQASPSLTPAAWYPVMTQPTQTNQMQFQFTADQPQMWYRVERSSQPPG